MLMKLKKDRGYWVFSSVSLNLAIEWKQNCKKKEIRVFHCIYCKEEETWGIPLNQKLSLE